MGDIDGETMSEPIDLGEALGFLPIDLTKYVLADNPDDWAAASVGLADASVTISGQWTPGLWHMEPITSRMELVHKRPWWAFWRRHQMWVGDVTMTGAENANGIVLEGVFDGPVRLVTARTMRGLRA